MIRSCAALVLLMLAMLDVARAATPPQTAAGAVQPANWTGLRAPPPNATPPGPVHVGVFLYSVQELDVAKHTFRVSFNIWWRYRGESYDPIATLQVVGARSTTVVLDDRRALPDGETYVDARVDAVIERALDTSAFPFDRHRLRIEIESPYEDDYLHFVVDSEDSMLDPETYSPGWRITEFTVHEERKRYPTHFGLHERSNDQYSRAVVEVTAQRQGWRLAIDYFIGFITSVLICLLGYLVHPRLLPARATIIGTAVFAAVGNKYVVNSLTGASLGARLVNVVTVTSFTMVLILMLSSIACERMIEAGDRERAMRTNRNVGVAAAIGCILVTVYVVWAALKG